MTKAHDYSKNFYGCNHYLTKKAIALAEKYSAAYGTKKFERAKADPGNRDSGAFDMLVSQGFLVDKGDGFYCRNKIVIGNPPKFVRSRTGK